MAEGSVPCFEHTVENGNVLKTCAGVSDTDRQGVGSTLEATTTDTRASNDCEPQPVLGYKHGVVGTLETRGPALDQEEELVQSLSKLNASGDSVDTTNELSTSALVASVEESGPEGGDPQQFVADGQVETASVEELGSGSSPQRRYSSRSFTFGKSQKKNRPLLLSKSKPPGSPKYRGSILRRKNKYVCVEGGIAQVAHDTHICTLGWAHAQLACKLYLLWEFVKFV